MPELPVGKPVCDEKIYAVFLCNGKCCLLVGFILERDV